MVHRDYVKDKGNIIYIFLWLKSLQTIFNLFIESLKTFFGEFYTQGEDGNKDFKYVRQLTNLAHREQVSMWLELDDLHDFDDELATAIMENTRRYENLVSDLIYEILPNYKEREVSAKDSLDVYIEHRLLMEARMRPNGEQRDARNKYPQDLMKRL